MIEPYNAVGLIPSFWGIRRREEIKHNIEHLKGLTKAAFWLSRQNWYTTSVELPQLASMRQRSMCITAPSSRGHSCAKNDSVNLVSPA